MDIILAYFVIICYNAINSCFSNLVIKRFQDLSFFSNIFKKYEDFEDVVQDFLIFILHYFYYINFYFLNFNYYCYHYDNFLVEEEASDDINNYFIFFVVLDVAIIPFHENLDYTFFFDVVNS